jgi:hypothetical protein
LPGKEGKGKIRKSRKYNRADCVEKKPDEHDIAYSVVSHKPFDC